MRVKVQDVRKATAVYFKMQTPQLLGEHRTHRFSHARQMAIAVARDLTRSSLPEIGLHFGGLDNSTAIYAVREVHGRTRADEDLAMDYWMLGRLAQSIAEARTADENELVRASIASGEIIPAASGGTEIERIS